MSYDLLIERIDGEPFERAAVDAAVAQFPQLRRYDAESFRSAESILTGYGRSIPPGPEESAGDRGEQS